MKCNLGDLREDVFNRLVNELCEECAFTLIWERECYLEASKPCSKCKKKYESIRTEDSRAELHNRFVVMIELDEKGFDEYMRRTFGTVNRMDYRRQRDFRVTTPDRVSDGSFQQFLIFDSF